LRDKTTLGYNDVDLNDLYDYLTWIKQEFKYDDTSTFPCILIIDELLDQMPFEMINLQQEYTRVCSFSILKKLHERHRHQMDNNGYIVTTLSNCQAMVNPDSTLTSMEDRMRNFFNYWLPSWKVAFNQMPTRENFHDILSQSDVFVYCGHGSGLNYCFSEDVYNFKTKAIVFLFGCASVGLYSTGLNSELKGAHIYYHFGSAPTGKNQIFF
jgi:separase